LEKPWNQSVESILDNLQVSRENGLSKKETEKRRRRYGSNRLEQRHRKAAWKILVDQFKNLIVLLLAVAALLSFSFDQWLEGFSITAAIFINAAIGFFTELKAVRSMEALQQMSRVSTRVRRNGRDREIPSEELVPGDLVILESGDIVSADLRLMEASRLQADESALTGESAPVSKKPSTLDAETPLAERNNMLFNGTSVTRGSGKGIVFATGMDTELGKIASLTEEAEEEHTPLEKRLNRLAYRLVWITLIIALFIVITGLIAGKDLFVIIETAIALAVAAIPEGLPIVATVALARGMWRMARHNALMNRLSAVETLGATNVICTDKTGTLTENRMTVERIVVPRDNGDGFLQISLGQEGRDDSGFYIDGEFVEVDAYSPLKESLEIGVLCNNAELNKSDTNSAKPLGDPMETALLSVGAKADIHREALLESLPEEREEAFDPEVKMMATFHKLDGRYRVAVKGAPEAILGVCSRIRSAENNNKEISKQDRNRWLERNQQLAETGLRILAVAAKTVDRKDANPYEDLVFLGLIGMLDPPRKDVKMAIEQCKRAGIQIVMVTGDQPVTARHIGASLGLASEMDIEVIQGKDLKPNAELSKEAQHRLLKAPIFARVTPKQKLDLIDLHQQNGSVVAMTGDGVNDAPALKKADIGVSMGQRGTQVAREASDMVLKDDAFETIVVAISQGRAIFDNIRKFILFLLSGNMGEIMIVTFALLVGAPLPILPLQILYLNMIGDVFPALALGVGKGDASKMEQSPRNAKEPVMTNRHWLIIVGYGLLIALPVLASFWLAHHWLHMDTRYAVTVAFLTLAFARLWHVFNMRDPGSRFFQNDVIRNPFVWGSLALCSVLLVGAVYLPGLSGVLKLVHPGSNGWTLIIGMSLIPWGIGQMILGIRQKTVISN
jgi:Ca2+-transporting ATPase